MPLFKRLFGLPDTGRKAEHRDVSRLIKVLEQSEDLTQRREAAVALGELHDDRSIPSLASALRKNKGEVHVAAIQALQKIGSAAAWDALVDYWLEESQWPEAAEAGKPAVPALIKSLYSAKENRRQAARLALIKIGAPSIPELLTVFETYTCTITGLAINTLVEIGEPALQPLLAALEDKNSRVRLAVVQTLGKLGDRRAIEPLARLIEDPNPDVRLEVVRIIGQSGDKHMANLLWSALMREPDPGEIARRILTPEEAKADQEWRLALEEALIQVLGKQENRL